MGHVDILQQILIILNGISIMTIQKRSHRASEQYHQIDSGTNYGPVIKSADCRLGQFGLSIYREAIHDELLDSVIDSICDNCPSYIINIRGEGSETHPAINIIEKRESRAIFRRLGGQAVQEVGMDDINNHLFYNISSLRNPLKVEPDSVEMFGGRKNSHDRVIGITIKGAGHDQILQERCDVIDGFNGLAHARTDEFCYIKPKDIHLSLARISLDTPECVVQRTLAAAREVLLGFDQLQIKKYSIYYPGANKR
jgi:hypothetical protein